MDICAACSCCCWQVGVSRRRTRGDYVFSCFPLLGREQWAGFGFASVYLLGLFLEAGSGGAVSHWRCDMMKAQTPTSFIISASFLQQQDKDLPLDVAGFGLFVLFQQWMSPSSSSPSVSSCFQRNNRSSLVLAFVVSVLKSSLLHLGLASLGPVLQTTKSSSDVRLRGLCGCGLSAWWVSERTRGCDL